MSNFRHINWLRDNARSFGVESKWAPLLMALAAYADKDGFCFPSQMTLTYLSGMSERQVRTGMRELTKIGLLEDTGRRKGQTGRVVVRRLTLPNAASGAGLPGGKCGTQKQVMRHTASPNAAPGAGRREQGKKQGKNGTTAPTPSKTDLVDQAKRLSANWRTASSKAPPELTATIKTVFGSWSAAGLLPEREWGFIGNKLYEAYLDHQTNGISLGTNPN